MLLFIDFRPGNWIVAGKRFSWASRSRVGVPLPSRVSLARPVLSCPLLYFTLTLAWPFCDGHDIFSHERTCLQSVFPSRTCISCQSWSYDWQTVIIWLTGNTCTREKLFADSSSLRVIVILVLFSCRNSWASSRETIRKMYFGKVWRVFSSEG